MLNADVYTSAVIKSPVEKVWSTIRDFNSLPEWHPFVEASELLDGTTGSNVGGCRKFTQKTGDQIKERLMALDDEEYMMKYFLLEAPALPVEGYVAKIKLIPLPDIDQTLMEWSVKYKVGKEDAQGIQDGLEEVFQMGFDSLNTMLA